MRRTIYKERIKFTLLMGILGLLLAGCSFSLAQDITPPPGYQRVSIERPEINEAVLTFPQAAPNLESGEIIFVENCAACHGDGGEGDGFQAGQLPNPPAPIGTLELATQSDPQAWYVTVTGGRLEKYMPPFQNSLSDQERWDVLSYVYSLSGSLDLFASALPFGLEEIEAAAALPENEPEEGEPQRPESEEGGEETVVTPTGVGVVTGIINNGSGGKIPAELRVTLLGFDEFQPTVEISRAVESDGTFRFEGLELPDGRVFLVTVDHEDMTYGSNMALVEGGETEFDLVVTIFDTTTDTNTLVIERMNIIVDFPDDETIRLVQLVTVSNTGDKTVIPEDEAASVISYQLPEDAINLTFNEGEDIGRFVLTEGGFGDTQAIIPGQGNYELLYSYDLPYERELNMILQLPLETISVLVLVPEAGVDLQSDIVVEGGVEQLGGIPYRVFANQTSLLNVDQVSLEMSGRNPNARLSLPSFEIDNSLYAGVGALLLSLGLVRLWSGRQKKEQKSKGVQKPSKAPSKDNPDDLIEAILDLEEEFEEGEIVESKYIQKRAGLKARLRKVM